MTISIIISSSIIIIIITIIIINTVTIGTMATKFFIFHFLQMAPGPSDYKCYVQL